MNTLLTRINPNTKKPCNKRSKSIKEGSIYQQENPKNFNSYKNEEKIIEIENYLKEKLNETETFFEQKNIEEEDYLFEEIEEIDYKFEPKKTITIKFNTIKIEKGKLPLPDFEEYEDFEDYDE